ncbi:hypothetical protein H6784_02870 [Candidatus Nomurabacteria bacterium]|nr:hypothetical protein [Candidatus Nomurabacteria bacterium]
MYKLKRIVIWGSLLGTVYLFILRIIPIPKICYENSDAIACSLTSEVIFNFSIFFPFILFFSLLTFKLKDSVFNAWWKFARVAIPVIFLISLYINLKSNPNGGGWFSIEDQVSLIELVILYSVFVIGSTIQIYRGHKGGSLGPS